MLSQKLHEFLEHAPDPHPPSIPGSALNLKLRTGFVRSDLMDAMDNISFNAHQNIYGVIGVWLGAGEVLD